jgi:anti-sigma factor RsiW
MSDMLEHGASGGAGPLPPSEPHDEFLELCATATTGSLSAEERTRLNAHLAQCESCREIMAQYQAIVGRVIPAWAADPVEEKRAPHAWSQDEAEAQLFARLGESERLPIQRESGESQLPPESLAAPNVRASSGDALWRHMWVQFAAALLLVAALGMIAYRTGIRRGLDLVLRSSVPTPSRPVSGAATGPETSASGRAPASATSGADQQLAALRVQLEERAAEIERLKTQLSQTQTNLNDKEADRIRLAQQRADLSQQLELASANLESVQQKLNSVTNQGSQDSARAAALEEKVNQLTASIGERDQEVARERGLLDHDRDIRELMGSRNLYIAEVYDVAKTGDTQKPFGRVFYTSGKSLIFYAYDLDQQPGIERASTFQAWGRRGPDRDHAVNLGILYQDNANKKRWVLKSDNPKTLEQIDAVFVTVEPNGGSAHPSGKPLLFAYLGIQPNHP